MQNAQTLCLAYKKHLQMVAVIVNDFCGSTVCKITCLFLPIPLPNNEIKVDSGNYMMGRRQRRFKH